MQVTEHAKKEIFEWTQSLPVTRIPPSQLMCTHPTEEKEAFQVYNRDSDMVESEESSVRYSMLVWQLILSLGYFSGSLSLINLLPSQVFKANPNFLHLWQSNQAFQRLGEEFKLAKWMCILPSH